MVMNYQNSTKVSVTKKINNLFLMYSFESLKGGERHQFVLPFIYASFGWFLHVPWLGIKPATVVYQDDTVKN